jgi:hypothetical protein
VSSPIGAVMRSVSVRSGSLVFPAPSSAFTVSGWPPRSSVRSLHRGHRWLRRDSSLVFVPVRRPGSARIGSTWRRTAQDRPAARAGQGCPICLSWASCPSTDVSCRVHSRRSSGELRPRRREVPPPPSRSVLAVSHGLDGLLHLQGRGLVASRCQSWGSPRFRADRLGPGPSRDAVHVSIAACLAARLPLEGAPSIPAVPRHRGLVPPWCCADESAVTFEALLRNPGL